MSGAVEGRIYFAYGSNMLTARLKERCESAVVVGVGFVSGFDFEFSKVSKDGSSKATLVPSPRTDVRAYGVLFELNAPDFVMLDRIEGLGFGYDVVEDLVVSQLNEGVPVVAKAYVAGKTDRSLRPYDWYKGLVMAGAREHQLPGDWIANLDSFESDRDRELDRQSHLEAVKILKSCGHDF